MNAPRPHPTNLIYMKKLLPALLPLLLLTQSFTWSPASKPWDRGLGTHRIIVKVDAAGDAAKASLEWRRRDVNPEAKGLTIIDLKTGKPVGNVLKPAITAERGEIVFQPTSGPGEYAVYFLPVSIGGGAFPTSKYKATEYAPDAAWATKAAAASVPASPIRWEALSAMDGWNEMEIIATAAETEAAAAKARGGMRTALVDAASSIRMFDRLPAAFADEARWTAPLTVEVRPGGVAMFQVMVWAATADLKDVRVSADKSAPGFTCLTTHGIDWLGRPFTKSYDLPLGRVQPFWCMVSAPADAAPGEIKTEIYTAAATTQPQSLPLTIKVVAKTSAPQEDTDPQSMSRLRWLNSTTAVDDEPAKGYPPLKVSGRTVGCLGREVELGADGLPARISSFYNPAVTRIGDKPTLELLAEPMMLEVVTTSGQRIRPEASGFAFTRTTPGVVEWSTHLTFSQASAELKGRMEFDGSLSYRIALGASASAMELSDVRLVTARTPSSATLMIGLQQEAGAAPATFDWKWDVANKHQDSVWLGAVNGGLRIVLKADNYVRPGVNIHYTRRPLNDPPSWSGGGKGGMTWADSRLVCFSGPRTLEVGKPLHFDFDLLVTPFHPLRTAEQWSDRYFHTSGVPNDYAKYLENAKKATANVINVHQGNGLNPYINYPFLTWDRLRDFGRAAEALGMRVKHYYTVRELSNWTTEIFALRSMGDELLMDGDGGGHPWGEEHLGRNYWQAWYQAGPQDVSILTQPMSRFHNYYIEGLKFLCEHAACSGIYLDDIAYDRSIMLRARKVLDRNAKHGGLIDLHSWNEFHGWPKWAHCANIFMDSMPFVDRLWFGEGHHYSGPPPEHFLVAISGIPYGLMGEMLEGGGNPGLGLVFGCTGRLGWGGNPQSVWKLWDEFGVKDAEFIGWWAGADCPVRASSPNVKATVWKKKGATLLAVANFSSANVKAALTIDWPALGLDPAKVKLYAPPMAELGQAEAVLDPAQPVVLRGHKGAVFILDETVRDLTAKPATGPGPVVFEDTFTPKADEGWRVVASTKIKPGSIRPDGGLVMIVPANVHAFIERPLPAKTGAVSARIWQDGKDEGQQWGPGLAVIWPNGKTLKANVRKDGRLTLSANGNEAMPTSIANREPVELLMQWTEQEVRVIAGGPAMGGIEEELGTFPRSAFPGEPELLRVGKMPNNARAEDHGDAGPEGFNRIEWVRVHGTAK